MREILPAVLAIVAGAQIAAAQGVVDGAVALKSLGLRTGDILMLRCDTTQPRAWLAGVSAEKAVRMGEAPPRNLPGTRWRIKFNEQDAEAVYFKLESQASATGARWLAGRDPRKGAAIAPRLLDNDGNTDTSWSFQYLYHSGNRSAVNWVALRNLGITQGAPEGYLNCRPGIGTGVTEMVVGTQGTNTRWYFYIERPRL